jgi:GNAT superfamily N-acetyltransferase
METIRPASEVPIELLHEVMEESFRDYFVNVHMELAGFQAMIQRESISLEKSVVVFDQNRPAGVGLLAYRSRASRVAAMGVVSDARGQGIGRQILQELVEAARRRRDRRIELEVIEQNIPALELYRSEGFTRIRRLVGFSHDQLAGGKDGGLNEIGVERAVEMLSEQGLDDLPWQISADSLLQGEDNKAFSMGGGVLILAGLDRDPVTIRSLVVDRNLRREGRATRLLKAAAARFPGKEWQVPVLFPQEMEPFFESMDFKRIKLSQLQMKRDL